MLRVGAVSYLNTRPLVWGLEDRLRDAFHGHSTLVFDLPSRLADRLQRGDLDVALIPTIEYLRGKNEYQIVSDAVIGCRGPVWSVRLLSRVPVDQIQSLALDEGSRTSQALAQILLWEQFRLRPRLVPFPITAEAEEIAADALLMIGDRAMHPPAGAYTEIWDLGDRWYRWSERPFVFAVWAGHADRCTDELSQILAQARDDGVAHLEQIAQAQAGLHGLTVPDCLSYFADHLHYTLRQGEREGMALFAERATALGLLEPRVNNTVPKKVKPRGAAMSIEAILEKAVGGARLTHAEGVSLLESRDLSAIGRAADEVSRRLHPEPYRTYNIDRNINYTNICTAVCDFCAFYRTPKSNEGYVLSREELLAKVAETVELGGNQILLQGGLHPKFTLAWYEELLSDIRRDYPQVNIHGFSPPELHHFTKVNKLGLEEVLSRLRAAGLGSIPGGGAEILVDRVRAAITRGKVMTDDWLNVMRTWHRMGGVSSATMMFGHVETFAERIEHLERLRDLQDETGGFTAFICWTFQPDHTEMSHIPPAGAFEYLKTQAIARLFLDNIPNIQSSWVTQGLKIGQLALLYGANDMGSLMIEENVVAEAGTVHFLTLSQIRDAISELGYVPRQRDVRYRLVEEELEQRAIAANLRRQAGTLVEIGGGG